MKIKSLLCSAALASITAATLQAHPGHDGHELVWEYNGGHIHLEPYFWTVAVALVVYITYRGGKKRDSRD
ncbi:MAG TPA: hypothetical protein VFT72_12435 [Opitutaceae bacterium]|nr:hypothetical protein [Opitutaceae bacterium]